MKKIILMLAVVALLISGCQKDVHKPEWTMQQEKVYTFSDGEYVNLWKERMFSWSEYRLTDGTTLLIEDVPHSVENTHVIGTNGYETLLPNAQEKISSFYTAQGLLYDVPQLLEVAYASYNLTEDKESFSPYRVGQSTSPAKSNDRVICFLTTVSLPIDQGMYTENRLSAYFDPKTGEQMSVWDLFKIPEDQAREWIVEQFNPQTQEYRNELRAALKDSNIMLSQSHLEIMFNQGEIKSQPYSTGAGVEYEKLKDVMHDWALAE